MSGLTLIYSRAVRLGDFVRIGDVEGTVAHLGSLSTKIKTEAREDVTIPNSVVVSTSIVNYSRFADAEGVFAPTKVTISYAVPWRQVHSMLLLAAERTPGIKRKSGTYRAADRAGRVLHHVHASRQPSRKRDVVSPRLECCGRTSRMSSTSSGCRSWHPTTKPIPTSPRSCLGSSGTPHRQRLRNQGLRKHLSRRRSRKSGNAPILTIPCHHNHERLRPAGAASVRLHSPSAISHAGACFASIAPQLVSVAITASSR